MQIELLRRMQREAENNEKRLLRCDEEIARFSEYEDKRLIVSHDRYYSVIDKQSGKNDYIGLANDEVRAIQQLRYWEKMRNIITRNLKRIECFTQKYTPLSSSELMKALPKAYQQTEGVFRDIHSYDNPYVEEWIERKHAERDKYPRYKPEHLKVRTLSGEYVRTKGEAGYYNMLYMFGIPFIYEGPIFIDDKVYYPDFTMLRLVDFAEIYHEHAGLLLKPDYADRFARKLTAFAESGIYAPYNLIITTESKGDYDTFFYKDILMRMLLIEDL